VRRIECTREADAFEAASLGRWPDRCDDELRAHVATCAMCAEVVAVTCALQDERHEAIRDAQILRSDLAWWRAERRAREEAAQAAARPIAFAHLAAVACAVIAALGLAGVAFGWLQVLTGGLTRLAQEAGNGASVLLSLTTLVRWSVPFAIGLGAWLVLAPVVLYLTVADD